MKLYTTPRLTIAALLRPGDQLAITQGGHMISTDAAYMDADLIEGVRWTVVHDTSPATAELLVVRHTLGKDTLTPGRHVVMREAVEIDPWTYVRPVDEPAAPAPRAPVR